MQNKRHYLKFFMTRCVYFNGKLLPSESTGISPFNRGLLYGDGVFETLRVYNGGLFRFGQHVQRLQEGLQVLKIQFHNVVFAVEQSVKEILQREKIIEGAVRISIFRGDGEGPDPPAGLTPSFLISIKSFIPYRTEDYATGYKARLVSVRRNSFSPLSRIKSLNYLDNILARLEAREHKAHEALLMNSLGWVAEGAASNVFLIKDNLLLTPPVDAGVLPGITRAAVLEIAAAARLQPREETFSPEQLAAADEAFLTNSLMEIMPLVMLNEKKIGDGKPGKFTEELRLHYRNLVNQEVMLPL